MKHRYYIVITAVVAFITLLVFAYWYGKSRGSAAVESGVSGSSQDVPPLITTAHPSQRTFKLRIPWIGTTESQASIELIALTAGRVTGIHAGDQARIVKGQPVMQLGGPQIEDKRAGIIAGIKSLETRSDLARQRVERLRESLRTQLATKDQLAAAQEAKFKLEARLQKARLSLKTLENQINITAPMDGVFTDRRVSTGQDIDAGQVVGEIIDTARLRITASLFPRPGIDVQGKESIIHLSENRTLSGVVRSVRPETLNTGATSIWIEGPEIDKQLRPGQTVRGDIIVTMRSNTLAVPESAIVYDSQEKPFLFVSGDGSYKRLSIQTGLQQDGWVEIVSGLDKEQSVVTGGAYELFYKNFNEQFKVQD